MTVSPLSRTTVQRLLAHISSLVEPLPQNIISKRLFHRHRFLNITHDDATEYLSSHGVTIQDDTVLPDLDHHLSVRYTADGEDLLAHAQIDPNARLVFLWEQENGWQFDSLAPMPFPSDAYPDLSDALAVHSLDDDEDSYWNAYGAGDGHHARPSNVDEPNSEDAYWSRYSTIQGSADSTIPSPLPQALRNRVTVDVPLSVDDPHPERIILPPTEFRKNHVAPYNPLEPPLPEELSHRLEALTGRFDSLLSPAAGQLRSESIIPSPHYLSIPDHHRSSDISKSSTSSPLPPRDSSIQVNSTADTGDAFDDLLEDSIKNLFKLWRSGRQHRQEHQDKELFMSTVRHALNGL